MKVLIQLNLKSIKIGEHKNLKTVSNETVFYVGDYERYKGVDKEQEIETVVYHDVV